MAFLASVALDQAADLLNDPSKGTFTNALLLTHLQTVYQRMVTKFALNDLPITETNTAKLDVAANVTVINAGSTPALPTDLIIPSVIWEKPDGATDDAYIVMEEVNELPQRLTLETLDEWIWRQGEIQFIGASLAVDIKITYEMYICPTHLPLLVVCIVFGQIAGRNTAAEKPLP